MRYKRFNGYLDFLNTFIYMVRLVYNSTNWCQSLLERNVFERKKNTKQNESCLQHEAYLRIKTESPYADNDTLRHMFECSQKSSENLSASTYCRTVFTQRLVSGHIYEVNIETASWSPFMSIRKSKYLCDIASKMKRLCYLIRTSHSSRSLGGTGYSLQWNRRGEFERLL